MADRKLFGVLSGAQVTFLGALAIIAPGAVYAVTYTSVVVTDPITGAQALVDNGRRQYVYDPIAGLANNPANLVQISGFVSGSQLNNVTTFYVVPPGKALILKSASISHYSGAAGLDNYAYFYGVNGNYITGFDDSNVASAYFDNMGTGYYVRSGVALTYYTSVPLAFSFRGILVPASAVPAAVAAAEEQSIQVGRPPKK